MVTDKALSSMDEILKVVEEAKMYIGEEVFKRDYLPLFKKDIYSEETIRSWLSVCKNPYYPVSVVDKEGKVLFTVPPILKRQKTRVTDDTKYTFSAILERAKWKSNVFPKKGEEFFSTCLDKISEDVESGEWNSWTEIFARYDEKMSLPTKSKEFLDADYMEIMEYGDF